ncbi:MAG: hypothetical protein NC254_07555 [bacterium]|nr:hypothetical protein [bacterium]
MKILKKILYFILGFIVLLCAFVLLCAVRPDITGRIAGWVHPDGEAGGTKVSVAADDGSVQPGLAAGLFGGSAGGGQDAGLGASAGYGQGAGSDADAGHGQGAGSGQDADAGYGQGAGYGQDAGVGGSAGYGQDAELGENADGAQEQGAPQSGSGMLAVDSGSGYTPPEPSDLAIPERVSGRNGYEPVKAQEEQLDDEIAGQIRDSLGTGETGDGLSFDPLYYPYYAMLDEKGQHVYRQIYANAGSCNRAFAPVEEVSAGQLSNVFSAVYNDHPELFWLNTAYSCKYVRGGSCVEIDLEFNRTAQHVESALPQFTAEAERILSAADALGSDYEKERYVHDALVEKASYDLGAEMNQSAYSALVNGRTVCAGYARAYQYLMQRLGIPCYYCTGYAGEAHAWNIVMLGNEYYNVDVTWDDTDGGNYDYFNRTDRDFADTHIRQELSVYLPPCNGQTYRGLEERETDGAQDGASGQREPAFRSLEEAGFDGEDVLHSLSEYYDRCYDRIVALGLGYHEFQIVIEGETLMDQLHDVYAGDDYRGGYLDRAMDAIGASACTMYFEVETLSQDRYLIKHKMRCS